MTTSVPVRQILLNDTITQHNQGFSPMRNNQQLALNYRKINTLTNLSLLASLVMGYYTFNKTYTGRKVYLLAFLGTLPVSGALFYWRRDYYSKILKAFNCEEKHFKDYLDFYGNALLDRPNYYEQAH